MAKPVKSQWDFGELFPPEQTRKVLSVADLTRQIKRLLEKQVGEIWVTGEVTNMRLQSSGHIYFTLKDADAQLSCVLFRGETQVDRSLLQDGRKVTLQGDVTVYEPRGQYQLRVTQVELQGIGALQVAFEKLKQLAGLVSREGALDAGRYGRVRVWGSVGFILAVVGLDIVTGTLRHGGHPVLSWMASNLMWEKDAADNWKPSKNGGRAM